MMENEIAREVVGEGTHPTEKGYAIGGKALIDVGIFN
jgi:hypothetical protein